MAQGTSAAPDAASPATPRGDRTGTGIEFRNVHKVFKQGRKSVTALEDVNITIQPGSIVGIIGYSGAGKSTLVRQINGLDKPTSGEILLDGQDIVPLKEPEMRTLRSDIGMIFQQFNLFSSRTVAGNIAYPLKLQGMPKAEREARVAELLEFVGLADKGRSYRSSSPVARSNAWASPAPWQRTRACCSPTRQPAPWTPPPPATCSRCCAASTRNWASPSW